MERLCRPKVRAAKKKGLREFPRSPGEKSIAGDITPLHLSRAMDRARWRQTGSRRAERMPRSWHCAVGSPIVSFVLPIDPLSYPKSSQTGSIAAGFFDVK